jgi:hypothetical protein
MKVIINNISINKDTAKEVKDTLLEELLLEMGVKLGLDLDKPVTSAVYVLSQNVDNENDSMFANMFKKKK